jgi:glycosyltransferase involved in cell wall biosynthesis
MAYGRPVVATAAGGLADAVVEGETGLVVPAGDAAALRRAIVMLLDEGETRQRLGVTARARASATLSWATATTAIVDVYGAAT